MNTRVSSTFMEIPNSNRQLLVVPTFTYWGLQVLWCLFFMHRYSACSAVWWRMIQGFSSSQRKLPLEPRAGCARYVSSCTDNLQAACTATLQTTPLWTNLFSLPSIRISTSHRLRLHALPALGAARCRKEKAVLPFYLLPEWTSSFT